MRAAGSALAATALVIALAAGAFWVRGQLHANQVVSLVGGTPETALATAATKLEAATGTGGSGFHFTVVSRSTLHAKAGGPQIDIPDPSDRQKSLGLVDEYYLGAAIAEGIARPDGFWLQMREGPRSKDASADFANAPKTYAALTRDNKTYRNDGDGWYVTDRPPGIGLDVATLAKLPSLLRKGSGAVQLEGAVIDGNPAARVAASGSIADAPGLLAIDAVSFTELTAPVEYALDGAGRLMQLKAQTRNLRQTIYDLIVEVVISFQYDSPPASLPEAIPLAPPLDDLPRPGASK